MWGLEHTVLLSSRFAALRFVCLQMNWWEHIAVYLAWEPGSFWCKGGGGVVWCSMTLFWNNLKWFSNFNLSSCCLTAQSSFGKGIQIVVCRKGSKLALFFFFFKLIYKIRAYSSEEQQIREALQLPWGRLWQICDLCVESNIFLIFKF